MVEFHPTSTIRCKNPGLPNVLTIRLLRYQRSGYRASWLLTSLTDAAAHSHSELVALYHRRWQIETVYREWKHGLDIQNLRSHTPTGVIKEIYAHLILSNLVRWVMTEAAQGTANRAIDLSYATALTYMKVFLVAMSRGHPRQIQRLYKSLLKNVRRAMIRKRPGRSYPRRLDKPRNRGHGYLQQPARIPKT